MKKLLYVLSMLVVAATLTACGTTETRPDDGTSVIKTTTRADGTVERVENLTDYAAYASRASESKPMFELTCPPAGCVISSLKVNAPTDKTGLAGPPKSIGMAVTEGFFSLGRDALGTVPWLAGVKVLNKAFDKANSSIDNSNRSTTNTTTDNSDRSTDASNRSTNIDNSNRSVNNSNNRNCNTGAPTGTTGQNGSSGPATC